MFQSQLKLILEFQINRKFLEKERDQVDTKKVADIVHLIRLSGIIITILSLLNGEYSARGVS